MLKKGIPADGANLRPARRRHRSARGGTGGGGRGQGRARPYAGVGALPWIKRVLGYAVDKAELEASPAVGIKPPAVPRVRERH